MFPNQKYWFYERGPVLLKLNERLQAENFQACFFEEFKKRRPSKYQKNIRNGTHQDFTPFLIGRDCVYDN